MDEIYYQYKRENKSLDWLKLKVATVYGLSGKLLERFVSNNLIDSQ